MVTIFSAPSLAPIVTVCVTGPTVGSGAGAVDDEGVVTTGPKPSILTMMVLSPGRTGFFVRYPLSFSVLPC